MPKHQTKIEKLISELCPKVVEVKSIGEICQINRGRVMSKDYLKDNAGEYPVYSSQTADNGIFGRIKTYDYNGEYLTWTTDGAYAGSIFYRNGKFSITNVCGLLKAKSDDVNMKFLSYILATVSKKYVSAGMGNPKIMSNVMEKIKIALPPLAVQEEIVKILNSFTELEAELEARKKQYEYYREKLLTFGDNIRLVELIDIANYSKTRIAANELNTESYVGVDNLLQNKQGKTVSDYVPKTGKLTRYEIGDILIGNIRPYLKKIWHATNIGGINGDVLVVHINEMEENNFSSDFLYHLLASDKFFSYNMQTAKGAKMPRGNKSSIMKYKIPVPSLKEQERIVLILDKFDALVNDLPAPSADGWRQAGISIGLPAELSARRSQYEYYRGKLLDFKPLSGRI